MLIHPPAVSKRYLKTKFLPYGMAVLYGFLKDHGVPVIQYDFLMEYLYHSPDLINYHDPARGFDEEGYFSFLQRHAAHEPLARFTEKFCGRLPKDAPLYAFSIVAYHQFWASLLMARRIKEQNPEALVVFGGPFVTIRRPEYLTGFGGADYWIQGSGELPLLTLYRNHRQGMIHPGDGVPGVMTLRDGRIVRSRPCHRPAGEETPPDFEHLDIDSYRYDHPLTGRGTLFVPYRISKGCVSRCSFCTGRLVDLLSMKPLPKIVGELSALADRYGTRAFMFTDSSLNNDPHLLSGVCKDLAGDFPGIAWYAYARVRGFTPALLEEVKKAGCFSLFWGVESAHEPTVGLLGKGFSLRDLTGTIEAAVASGIHNTIHLMYNTPHETEKDIAALIGFIERYIGSDRVTFIAHRFLLEPQSLLFSHPEKYGLAKIEKVPAALFEREQYRYEEAGGVSFESIGARDEKHREMLKPCLDAIEERASLHGAAYPFREWL